MSCPYREGRRAGALACADTRPLRIFLTKQATSERRTLGPRGNRLMRHVISSWGRECHHVISKCYSSVLHHINFRDSSHCLSPPWGERTTTARLNPLSLPRREGQGEGYARSAMSQGSKSVPPADCAATPPNQNAGSGENCAPDRCTASNSAANIQSPGILPISAVRRYR